MFVYARHCRIFAYARHCRMFAPCPVDWQLSQRSRCTAQSGPFFPPGIFALVLRTMADESNSFQLSVDALNELDRMHDNHQFVKYDKVELYLVKPEDDPGTERIVYGFGSSCPLALAKGVTMCKSFKEKLFVARACSAAKWPGATWPITPSTATTTRRRTTSLWRAGGGVQVEIMRRHSRVRFEHTAAQQFWHAHEVRHMIAWRPRGDRMYDVISGWM